VELDHSPCWPAEKQIDISGARIFGVAAANHYENVNLTSNSSIGLAEIFEGDSWSNRSDDGIEGISQNGQIRSPRTGRTSIRSMR
jgi:hypothetical protein